jgi:isoquinoline 1-oxidoreductase beta subunit
MAKKIKKIETVYMGRRRFLKVAVLGGAGLALGVYLGFGGEEKRSLEESWGVRPGSWTPNAWLRIDPDGTVTVRVNHSEMGQGVTTGLPTLVAEELEVPWSRVRFEIAPVEEVYKNPAFNAQMTGGSTSTPTSWDVLRQAGALAREMLICAAALTWGVEAGTCRAEEGVVIHIPSKRRLGYEELATRAAQLDPPRKVRLKDPASYRLIGRDLPRLDAEEKIEGEAVFGMDVRLPGLLTATVVHPPVFGDGVKSFKAEKALAMPGVRRVMAIDTGVAIVADTFWQARQATEAVEIEWDGKGNREVSSGALWKRWAELARGKETLEAKELFSRGEPDRALKGAARTIRAAYRLPFQAHATAEPMNCTAHVEKDRCRIWAPTQNQDGTQEVAARLTGLGYGDIEVYTTYLGGGFGRRGAVDFVVEAVELSRSLGAPVKVIWSREEDIAHDLYRPASYHRLRAGLDGDGRPIAWTHRIVGPDHLAKEIPSMLGTMMPYWVPRGLRDLATRASTEFLPSVISGGGVKGGAAPLPYAIGHVRVDYVHDDPGVPVGFWRSVGNSANAFVVECFLDEIAAAGGRDPVALRMELLNASPRMRAVLELAARQAGWSNKPPVGIHRGVAVHEFHGTFVAMVAEVSVDSHKQVRVHRVVCAVDCGRVINPRIVRAQVAGGLIFGLTATLKSEITLKKGRVRQSNFHDFPILTLEETPRIEVHPVKSEHRPSGIGEVGVPPIAPAVANAVFAATGKRLRKLPLELA